MCLKIKYAKLKRIKYCINQACNYWYLFLKFIYKKEKLDPVKEIKVEKIK